MLRKSEKKLYKIADFCHSNKMVISAAMTYFILIILFTLGNTLSAGETVLVSNHNEITCDSLTSLNKTALWPTAGNQTPFWFMSNLTNVCAALKSITEIVGENNDTVSVRACARLFFNSPKNPTELSTVLPSDFSLQFPELLWFCSRGLFDLRLAHGLFIAGIFTLIAFTCAGISYFLNHAIKDSSLDGENTSVLIALNALAA